MPYYAILRASGVRLPDALFGSMSSGYFGRWLLLIFILFLLVSRFLRLLQPFWLCFRLTEPEFQETDRTARWTFACPRPHFLSYRVSGGFDLRLTSIYYHGIRGMSTLNCKYFQKKLPGAERPRFCFILFRSLSALRVFPRIVFAGRRVFPRIAFSGRPRADHRTLSHPRSVLRTT